MSLKKRFKVDAALAASGVWLNYEENEDGSVPRFLVARMTKQNKKYSKALRSATKDLDFDEEGKLQSGSLGEEQAETMLFDVFNESVLLGWENFQPEDDGVNLEYSKENALATIGSPDWMDFYEDLQERAKKAATFNVKKMEADAKNS